MNKPPVDPKTWTQFIETGQVPTSTLYQIARKIKANQPTSVQERTIYQYHSTTIEQILKDL